MSRHKISRLSCFAHFYKEINDWFTNWSAVGFKFSKNQIRPLGVETGQYPPGGTGPFPSGILVSGPFDFASGPFLRSSCPGPNRQTGKTLLLSWAMIDEWNEELWCPECGKTGIVSLSHPKGDQVPTVQKVSDGFKVISTQYGPHFHCGTCNIAVAP
jgi:hypothetical protein